MHICCTIDHPLNRRKVSRLARHLTIIVLAASIWCAETRGVMAQAKASRKAAGPITEKEAEEYGKALEQAVEEGENDRAAQMISWNDLLAIGTKHPNLPELNATRESFKTGVLKSLKQSGGFHGPIIQTVKNGAAYEFLRSDVKAAEPYVLFRLKHPNNAGLNYHRLYLIRRPDKSVVANDVYILATGERLSAMMHRSWLPLASQIIRDKNKKNAGEAAKLDADIQALAKITQLVKDGKFEEALESYRQSSESVRKDKTILIVRLTAAQNHSDDEYLKAMDDFRKYHPDDPVLDFILVDAYTTRKEYDKAMECIDRTIENLGVDAALLGLKANLLILQEKLPEALVEIKKAMAAEPDSQDPYMAALNIAVACREHDETANLLTTLTEKFKVEWKDLHEVEAFSEFVKTPQYEKWAAAQKKK